MHTPGGAGGTPCKDKLAGGIQARLDGVRTRYDQMLDLLHQQAPKAKILAVGYPTVIPADTAKCEHGNGEHFGTITLGDLDWLRQDVLEPLNAVIEKSADAHDATTFVDLYDSSKDHSVCDDANRVEGLTARNTDGKQPALVHPNAQGHRNAADHVEEAMLNAVDMG